MSSQLVMKAMGTCGTASGVDYRSVLADGGGDLPTMLAWVNAYDITTLAWGSSYAGFWAGNTTPGAPPASTSSGAGIAANQAYQSFYGPAGSVQHIQIALDAAISCATGWFLIYTNWTAGGPVPGSFKPEIYDGCSSFPGPCRIIDLQPPPNQNDAYLFALQGSADLSALPWIVPDLASFANAITANGVGFKSWYGGTSGTPIVYAGTWDDTVICGPSDYWNGAP